MPRTFTTPQRNAAGGAQLACFGKLEVTDPDGTWRDVGALGGLDWFNTATITDSIDQNTLSFSATLARDIGNASLSPYRSNSTINRNAANAYAPMLDAHRYWRVSSAVLTFGATPVAGDWKELGKGIVDRIDIQDRPGIITITGRGMEADLLDAFIPTVKLYGSVPGTPMETVLQAMLDDTLGPGAVTLYTPVSPSFVMKQWAQQPGNLMGALTAVAEKAGFVLRYRYDASDVLRFTLYKPNRTASVADWSIGAGEYLALPSVGLDLAGIRNYVELTYIDATLGKQTVISPAAQAGTVSCTAGAATFSVSQAGNLTNGAIIIVAGVPYTVSAFNGTTGCTLSGAPTFGASAWRTSPSITRFGLRYMAIDLSGEAQITTSAQAQAMADAVRSDLELPPIAQQVETFGLWFVQLADYGQLLANAVHYDSDQYGGVTGYTHTFANGTLRTSVSLRGKPAGGYRSWLVLGTSKEDKPATGAAPIAPTVSLDVLNADATDFVAVLSLSVSPGTTPLAGLTYTLTRKVGKAAPITESSGSVSAMPATFTATRYARLAAVWVLAVTDPLTGTTEAPLTLGDDGRDGARGAGAAVSRTDEDDTRAGMGGVPTRGGQFSGLPLTTADGSQTTYDPALGRLTDAMGASDGLGPPESAYMGKRRGSRAAGHAQARVDEDDRRSGTAGVPVRGQRILSDPYYTADGGTALLDPTTGRAQTGLAGPTGIGMTVIERGGNKGDNAIDSGNVVVAGSWDGSRAYTGKHLGNIPDDATSDRRAATANEKTGGSRGFNVIDSGLLIVSSAVDMARAFLNKHLGNIADDATSDRRAATLNQKTGGDRGFNAIDSGNVLVTTGWDGSRAYTGKHLGNVPDDATSDRKAVTNNEKTGAGRGYNALSSGNKLATGVETTATAADGVAGIESTKGSNIRGARQSGHAGSQVGENESRSGLAGVPVPSQRALTMPIMDATNAVPLIDPVTKTVKPDLFIGAGVRGASDVAFGASVKYAPNRHNEDITAKHGDTKPFAVSYEQIPKITPVPSIFLIPGTNSTVDRKFEFRATGVSVSGFTARAVYSTGSSSSAATDNFDTTQNTTPGGGSVSLSAPSATAFCQLASANTTLTTYTAVYDVDTTAMPSFATLTVSIYRNTSAGDTTGWTLVGTNTYTNGVTLSGEHIGFDAALGVNFDVKLVITYSTTLSAPNRATVTAKRVDYNVVTAGSEVQLTSGTGDTGIVYQVVEPS